MTKAFEQIMAEHRAEQQRQLAAARQRIILFALESIAGDGLPRVSAYTVEYRLTAEGRIALQANPAEGPASDELELFGAV